jgi:hypothetical protein
LEGPYKIVRVNPKSSYIVETLKGEQFPSDFNGRYLQKYYVRKCMARHLSSHGRCFTIVIRIEMINVLPSSLASFTRKQGHILTIKVGRWLEIGLDRTDWSN